MDGKRFDRSILFFGKVGQERLRTSRIGVVGVGGLGTHVVQQLALLGVGHLTLVDHEELDDTNRNRYIGARHDDPVPGTPKVDIAARLVTTINPSVKIEKVQRTLLCREALDALTDVSHIFGCLDHDALRLVLTELSAAYELPYVDCATEILPGDTPEFGGRVCSAWAGDACLSCLDELDPEEARDAAVERDRAEVYGLTVAAGEPAPSVVSLNGVVASLATTEFVVALTGIRPARPLLTYYGSSGTVRARTDPRAGCYYCKGLRGARESANLHRHATPVAGSSAES